jgi:hypothetical protein
MSSLLKKVRNSIKNGKDNVPIEDTCLEEERQILSEIGTLSLTFVMFFCRFLRD